MSSRRVGKPARLLRLNYFVSRREGGPKRTGRSLARPCSLSPLSKVPGPGGSRASWPLEAALLLLARRVPLFRFISGQVVVAAAALALAIGVAPLSLVAAKIWSVNLENLTLAT